MGASEGSPVRKPVVFFDIGCRDLSATVEFYESMFGWKADRASGMTAMIDADQAGLSGAITALGHEPHNYVMIYVETPDLEADIQRAIESGGEKLIGPAPTPDGRLFAWMMDPAGNRFGLVSARASDSEEGSS